MRVNKKIMGLALSIGLIAGGSSNYASAMDRNVVYSGQNYINEETGEYIIWHEDERTARKSFSFKIKYSVTSSSFKPGKSSVYVKSSANVEEGDEIVSAKGHRYSVSLRGDLFAKTVNFKVDGVESGTISGLNKDKSYTIQIDNNDALSGNKYLVGIGSAN